MKKITLFLVLFCLLTAFSPGNYTYQIARLKYSGGGDWYAGPTSLPNLVNFCNENLKMNINPEEAIVDVADKEIFNYPWLFMTGHGNIVFSTDAAENLRNYLSGGGFLLINDSYGMDPFVRSQMKKVFPELDFIELPFNHPIYHQKYDFNNGLPKIHEHDEKAPQGFGLIYNGRLVCFYNYECDLGDGWEDYEVHKDSPETHLKALKMGANILQYAFVN